MTKAYLGDVSLLGVDAIEGDRGAFSPQMRRELAEKWMRASYALGELTGRRDERIKNTIQEREQGCFNKRLYWANPGSWRGSTAEIKLDNLIEEIRKFLTELRGGR